MSAKRRSRKSRPTEKNHKETKRAIPISRLVPSELFLERKAVDQAKSTLESRNVVLPIVVPIGRLIYVLDGNHPVKSSPEPCKKRIECPSPACKKKRNVAT